MPAEDPHPLPPGRQLYDPLNGLRVGALSGGLAGAIATAAASAGFAWLILVGAVAGGAIGFWYERRSLRRRRAGPPKGAGDRPSADDSPAAPGA